MTSVDEPDIARARGGVVVLFVGMGVALGTQVARVPSIRDDLGVSPAQLAAIFIVGSLGGLVSFSLVGWASATFGSLRLVRVATVGTAVGFWAMGAATHLGSPVVFAASAFVGFAFWEAINTLANAEAATVERLIGRSIMSQFHAAFSLAMLTGIGLGVLFSRAHVAVVWHYGIVISVVSVANLLCARRAIVDGAPAELGSAERDGGVFVSLTLATRERRTLFIGIIVFCAFAVEMASADWVPLAVVDNFGQTEAVAGTLYTALIIAMSGVRIVGSRIIDRFGRVAVLRVCAVCVVIGSAAFAFTPAFWSVPIALFVWGVGSSLGYPLAISAAADDRSRATARVAAAAAFGTIAGLTMPQLIGFLAEGVELRKALLVVVAAAIAMFILAPSVRPLAVAAGDDAAGIETLPDPVLGTPRRADTLGL